MNQNILLSKIVANATDSSWTQAYSTLNLYIVINIKKTGAPEKTIASVGRELLEKLQREFFAQDEKHLATIKEAVAHATEQEEEGFVHSIILTTIVKNIAYIVIANAGAVILKRGEDIGIIAKGEKNTITSFSGTLANKDLLVLSTDEFLERISHSLLTEIIKTAEFLEISEHLAPLLHEKSQGTEAAILLEYHSDEITEAVPQEKTASEEHGEKKQSSGKLPIPHVAPPSFSSFPKLLPKILNIKSKKLLLIAVFIILVALFIGSILFEKQKQETQKRQALAKSILAPAQKKYEEAEGLLSLNNSLALENFTEVKTVLSENQKKFAASSNERREIDALIEKVDAKLKELEKGVAAKNEKVLVAKDKLESSSVTVKGGDIVLGGKKIALVTNSAVSILAENNVSGLVADKNFVYALADDGIYKIDKKSKNSQKIITLENTANYAGIETFLGNLYLLNKSNNAIEKYSDSSFTKSSYLTGDAKLADAPASFTIDSSVWVGENGKIQKFTRGKEVEFSIKGLVKPLGRNIIVYTDESYSQLYAVDKDNRRLVVLAKNGDFQNQYESKILGTATSLAVDEAGKKVYVVSDGNLSSFDL